MNRISIFLWTLKVIESCKTLDHLSNCTMLINRNFELYEDIGINMFLSNTIEEMADTFKNKIEQACLETNEYLEQ